MICLSTISTSVMVARRRGTNEQLSSVFRPPSQGARRMLSFSPRPSVNWRPMHCQKVTERRSTPATKCIVGRRIYTMLRLLSCDPYFRHFGGPRVGSCRRCVRIFRRSLLTSFKSSSMPGMCAMARSPNSRWTTVTSPLRWQVSSARRWKQPPSRTPQRRPNAVCGPRSMIVVTGPWLPALRQFATTLIDWFPIRTR